MPFSSSKDVANDWDDALSCCAIFNKEDVRDSCSVRLCVKSASVVAVDMPVLSRPVEEAERANSSARGFRARRVETGSGSGSAS